MPTASGPESPRLVMLAERPLPGAYDLDRYGGTENRVERIALDVCHRLNAATPITPSAAVCIALLAEDLSTRTSSDSAADGWTTHALPA